MPHAEPGYPNPAHPVSEFHLPGCSFLSRLVLLTLSLCLAALGLTPTMAQTLKPSLSLSALPTELPTAPNAQPLRETDPKTSAVGASDQLTITVYGQPDMGAEVTINDNGQITLPLIGTLKVTGMTPPAIEQAIARRLKDGDYLKNPEVSVQVRQLKSQMISVLGEVQKPGRFPLQGRMTVLEALATAGGLTGKADRQVLVLRRKPVAEGAEPTREEIPIVLDPQSSLGRGRLDLELVNDDVVFIGIQKQFYVHGEVRKPGAYPMEPELNIMRVLSIAGGVTERGSMGRISIHRRNADQELKKLPAQPDTPVENGDVVFVDERFF